MRIPHAVALCGLAAVAGVATLHALGSVAVPEPETLLLLSGGSVLAWVAAGRVDGGVNNPG